MATTAEQEHYREFDGKLSRLTPRELEVLEARSQGMDNEEIGNFLGISIKTVDAHISMITARTGSQEQFVTMRVMVDALQQGLITRERIVPDQILLLSDREREILALMPDGKGNDKIARILGISKITVSKHSSNIFRKLHARNRYHAVAIGVVTGQIS